MIFQIVNADPLDLMPACYALDNHAKQRSDGSIFSRAAVCEEDFH
jgi:hypothetical protein